MTGNIRELTGEPPNPAWLKEVRYDADALLWRAGQGFFAGAILIVAADATVLRLLGRHVWPNPYALSALAIALVLPLAQRIWTLCSASGAWSRGAISAWSSVAVFTAFWALYSVTGSSQSLDATGFNEPVRQAYAFIHGRAWVEPVPGFMEHLTFHGRTLLVHPPLAAFLLAPLVALWGLAVNQTAVSVVVGAVEIALAWRLLGLLQVRLSPRLWLTLFFGLGTTLWFEATVGNSWDFVLVCSVLMTMLALNELFGSARPWLMGALTGAAALARNDQFLVWPIYAAILYLRGRPLRELWKLLPGWGLALAVYGWFNYMRYGTVVDLTFSLYYPHDPAHLSATHGPFSVHYLPNNLYTLLFIGPTFSGRFPWIRPTAMGQSLPLTSPAFVLALRPSFKQRIMPLLLLAALAGSLPSLTVYASGYVQFGARYYIQAYPFLLAMMAMGMKRRADQLSKILIVTSIALVAFGLWQVRTLGFG